MEDRAKCIARMRTCGETDDGKPVYLQNLSASSVEGTIRRKNRKASGIDGIDIGCRILENL